MDKKMQLQQWAEAFVATSPLNVLDAKTALRPELAGLRYYDAPLVGVAAAEDPLFEQLRRPGVVGPHHLLPGQWLAEAKSVVCMFLPLSGQVRGSNRQNYSWPSDEWRHARYDGEALVQGLALHIAGALQAQGCAAVAPVADARFAVGGAAGQNPFTSNWSERHVAYVAGLGTFSLTRGLITRKGMAGRLCSVVTAMQLAADERPYTTPFEYCSRCGACIGHCPVGAISMKYGKRQQPCRDFLDRVCQAGPPRYGCGKCQVGVPCEAGVPRKAAP